MINCCCNTLGDVQGVTSIEATAQEELSDFVASPTEKSKASHGCQLDPVWKYGNLKKLKYGKRPFPSDGFTGVLSCISNEIKRDVYGEPSQKYFKWDPSLLPSERRCFTIGTGKGSNKREVKASFEREPGGVAKLELTVQNWCLLPQYTPSPLTASVFAKQMRVERLTSVCSYHDIKTTPEHFHCVWHIENPAKSGFFQKDARRSRASSQLQDDALSDVTINGPIFDGVNGTQWQVIAYPYGYRNTRHEDTKLVAMAVRYNNGPESQVNAGFQITLLPPEKLNHTGLQETIHEHIAKLKESSKRSNTFKRGKKGWVLRKFSSRAQIHQFKRSSMSFVLSFCVYTTEQIHCRHPFYAEPRTTEDETGRYMKKLWNNGAPTGKTKIEAKSGKTFRVNPTALQLNGGAVAQLSARQQSEPRNGAQFTDMTEAVLRKVLEYCHTLSVTRLERTPFEVLLAAYRYNINGLQSLAEHEVAKYIDLDNILDLYAWNQTLQSSFLKTFIDMFISTNFGAIRQMPEFAEKLTTKQQEQLEQRFGGAHCDDLGFCDSESNDGIDTADSDMDSDDDHIFNDGDLGGAEADDDYEENIGASRGEEPEEPQPATPANMEHLDAAADQALIIANMLGDFEIDPDALEFFLLLM